MQPPLGRYSWFGIRTVLAECLCNLAALVVVVVVVLLADGTGSICPCSGPSVRVPAALKVRAAAVLARIGCLISAACGCGMGLAGCRVSLGGHIH